MSGLFSSACRSLVHHFLPSIKKCIALSYASSVDIKNMYSKNSFTDVVSMNIFSICRFFIYLSLFSSRSYIIQTLISMPTIHKSDILCVCLWATLGSTWDLFLALCSFQTELRRLYGVL